MWLGMNMFKISEFSKFSRVPVKTLRYYDEIGLFSPAQVDRFTYYRYYSAEQLPRLNRILVLKEMGLSLAEITRLLNEQVSLEELRGMFRLKEAEVRQQVEDAQARLALVANRLKQIEQEGKMPEQDVLLKRIEPLYVFYLRQIAPTPSSVGDILGESWVAMEQQRIMPIAPPIAIFYDDEFMAADLDIAVAFPVDKSVKQEVALPGGRALGAQTLPEIATAACIIHHGSFDTINQSYSALATWMEANGYRVAGHPREVYLAAPEEGRPPVTEIQFPVEKRPEPVV
jgi:DNA-binding transcriptional MerR regulator